MEVATKFRPMGMNVEPDEKVTTPAAKGKIRVTYISHRGSLAYGTDNFYPEFVWITYPMDRNFDDKVLDLMINGFWLDTHRRRNPGLRVFIPPSAIIEISQVEEKS